MQDAQTITCTRHPEVETALRCGRCDTPICPRCLVYTPGGTRCPDCARLRRPPMYELAPLDYVRAAVATLVVALPLGYLGALLLPPRPSFGLFLLVIAAAAGWAAGSAIGEVAHRVTNGKRGRGMQVVAAVAVLLLAGVRLGLAGLPLDLVIRDIGGLLMVVVALSAATGRLR